MSHPFALDRDLLDATSRRHAAVLPVLASVYLSAAVDALTDPLAPPALECVDPARTADLLTVVRTVREDLLTAADTSPDPQLALTAGQAARELTDALAALASPLHAAGPAAVAEPSRAAQRRLSDVRDQAGR